MTKLLTLEEMIECARRIDPEGGELRDVADTAVRAIEAVGTTLAKCIAARLGVMAGKAEYEPEEFSGTCAPFYALQPGQPCPEPLRGFDDAEWSTLGGGDLDPETGEEI